MRPLLLDVRPKKGSDAPSLKVLRPTHMMILLAGATKNVPSCAGRKEAARAAAAAEMMVSVAEPEKAA